MSNVEEGGRRIIVAVDEGEESLYALSWCVKNVIAPNSKDTVILLHARPPQSVYTAMDGTGYLFSSDIMATMERYSNDMAEFVIEKAKKLCKDLPHVKVETCVETGDPRDVICKMVDKLGADILVMGSHGYGPIKRAFIGSVSNHCAKTVKCPILIVKKPKDASSSSGN